MEAIVTTTVAAKMTTPSSCTMTSRLMLPLLVGTGSLVYLSLFYSLAGRL